MKKRKITALLMSVILTLTYSLIFVPPIAANTATVATYDNVTGEAKTDFAPSETVLIKGTGFLTFTAVTVDTTRPDTVVDTGSAITDADGNFSYQYVLDGIWGEYQVSATDGTNTATCTFTDSPVPTMYSLPAQTVGTSQTVTWEAPWAGVKEYEVQGKSVV